MQSQVDANPTTTPCDLARVEPPVAVASVWLVLYLLIGIAAVAKPAASAVSQLASLF